MHLTKICKYIIIVKTLTYSVNIHKEPFNHSTPIKDPLDLNQRKFFDLKFK